MHNKYYQYYVEGKCEEKFINELKTSLGCVVAGKVQVLNVVNEKLSRSHLMLIKPKTCIILVYDTDTSDSSILSENVALLKKCRNVSEVIHVQQVLNFENEILKSTNVRSIACLTGSKSNADFKRDFIRTNNVAEKLKKSNFNIDCLWSSQAKAPFNSFENEAFKIKK